ncbi:hypothetical protein JT358_12095 [Micrococcales bacterium 31B]|nr:hypothetical protein [Micrococcales bacterium 31B]
MNRTFSVSLQALMFVLIATMSLVLTAFQDRDVPQDLGAQARVQINFPSNGDPAAEKISLLQGLDAEYDLGLYRVVPNPQPGGPQHFARLRDAAAQGDVNWFVGGAPGQIVGSGRLQNSVAEGIYLVTNTDNLDAAMAALASQGGDSIRMDTSALDYVINAWRLPAFAAPLAAVSGLSAAISIFVLASRANSRALRVLGGADPSLIWRVDLGHFFVSLLGAAAGVGAVTALAIAILRGPAFVGTFCSAYLPFSLCTLAAAALIVGILSGATKPSVKAIALREPAVRHFRWPSLAVQVITLGAVVVFSGSTWVANTQAQTIAQEQSVWNRLSDLVSLRVAMTSTEFEKCSANLRAMMTSLEAQHQVLASLYLPLEGSAASEGFDGVVIANREWVQRVAQPGSGWNNTSLTEVAAATHGELVEQAVQPSFDVWSEHPSQASAMTLLTTSLPHESFPASEPGVAGAIQFVKHPLIVVIPSVDAVFDATNQWALISSSAISFADFDALHQQLDDHELSASDLVNAGVTGGLFVEYVAENGQVTAMAAKYSAQLLFFALAVAIVAFGFTSAAAGLIAARIAARHDFPLRLAGKRWGAILSHRIALDLVLLLLGGYAAVLLFQRDPDAQRVSLVVAPCTLAIIVLAHYLATQYVFKRVTERSL